MTGWKTRVEVWSTNNARLAVNSGEKIFSTAKHPHFLALNAMKAVRFEVFSGEIFFHRINRISYKKETGLHGFEPLNSCLSTNSFSTAPSVTYFSEISIEFKISCEIGWKYL